LKIIMWPYFLFKGAIEALVK